MAKRLVRAKTQDPQRGHPVPGAARRSCCPNAPPAVLAVLYLLFNEGYAATAGADLVRAEPVRRGDPPGPAAGPADARRARGPTGCSRSCCCIDSRRAARTDDAGELVTLEDQDRGAVGRERDRRGRRPARDARCAAAGPGPTRCRRPSPPATPRAATAADTDWAEIAALYGELARLVPVAGGRAEPGGGRGHGRRPGRRAGAGGPAGGRRARWPATTCCPPPAPTCCAACTATPTPRPRTGRPSTWPAPTPSAATWPGAWPRSRDRASAATRPSPAGGRIMRGHGR